ncbi:MAG: YjbQ family protein [Candidatus Thorarchaeota archaeon]|nr:YjbQ family protein [Candidatus Thorarchaeota archaeon]
MGTYHSQIHLQSKGNTDIIDITDEASRHVAKSALRTGTCTLFCAGSTASVMTIEYEDGLLKDFPDAMERIAPQGAVYEHHLRWGDGNGHSHVRASVIGPSLTIPFVNGRLTLGTWQQVAFVDFDIRPRSRTIEVLILGE